MRRYSSCASRTALKNFFMHSQSRSLTHRADHGARFAAMLDITESKRAEDQLEQSNQKLNEILASIQDDFYVIDHNWIFVYANRQFTTKLGKEPEDLIGNNIWKMFPKHVGMPFGRELPRSHGKREIRRFEIPGQYTNAWYSITVFPSRRESPFSLGDHRTQALASGNRVDG